MDDIVIIGAGQAGGSAAQALRDNGFAGRIHLFGDEPYPPYERPPLSKEILQGEATPDSSFLWSPDKQVELAVEMHLGIRIEHIDRERRQVVTQDGEAFPYGRLLLTTGSRVRQLEVQGATLGNIHYLRGIDDALAIKPMLTPGAKLIVVGAGWIGLEVAASARQLGAEVVVTDVCERACMRVLPEDIGHYLMRRHRDNGVRLLMKTTAERFIGTGDVEAVRLSNGDVLPASAVVIGVGVVPNSELAIAAGLATDNGVVVDEFGRTSDALVFAAGDVASQQSADGARVRYESWTNAQNQSIATARSMLGQGESYRDIPYFWSDQYDLSLQMVGSPEKHDEIALRGSFDSDKFIKFYLHGGRIASAIAVNSAQDISVAKRLIQRNIKTSVAQLRDGSSLRHLLTP